jgi:hypothetical protein
MPPPSRRYCRGRKKGGLPDPLPVAHRTYIDMDEIRGRVAADTTRLQSQRGLMQFFQVITRQPNINGLSSHMAASLCNAGAPGVQHRIGGGRTITGNDVETAFACGLCLQQIQQTQQPFTHTVYITGAVVAEIPVNLLQTLRLILSRRPADCFQCFVGVGVIDVC